MVVLNPGQRLPKFGRHFARKYFLGTGEGAADEEEGLLSDLVCDEEEQDESTEYFLATDTGSVAATETVEPIVTLELSET